MPLLRYVTLCYVTVEELLKSHQVSDGSLIMWSSEQGVRFMCSSQRRDEHMNLEGPHFVGKRAKTKDESTTRRTPAENAPQIVIISGGDRSR